MSFLLEKQGLTDGFVNSLLEVFELLWHWAIASSRELDVVVLLIQVETQVDIDVLWKGISKLRKADVLHGVISSTEHDEVLLYDILAEGILWKHSAHSINQNSLRVFL
jgi:hypothetical protein